jgi:hypothetical protein
MRILARAISGVISEIDDPAIRERSLDEIREFRRAVPHDRNLAKSHLMALTNSCEEAVTDAIIRRNQRYLTEFRGVVSSFNAVDLDVSGYDINILASIYLGLLRQQRYEEATEQLAEMAGLAQDGTSMERLEWLIAIRHGFWILRDNGRSDRFDEHIEQVRVFRRRHPEDEYEAPDALLAMLLGAFEFAELRREFRIADEYFEEACSLVPPARDCYGHVSRLERQLWSKKWPDPDRAAVFSERLSQLRAKLS